MSLAALKDLFARHRARTTGHWRLGQDIVRTVFLESGDVVFATSAHPQDRLTSLLVERGKLTQAQLDYAMANLNPGMSIGKNLIEMGFITQRDLLDVARAQVERIVWGCMADPVQAPEFEEKDLDATTVRLPFDTAAMLLAGVLALKDREGVLEELGPLNQVVLLEGKRIQELTLPPDLTRLPGLLDGSRTLLELSRETGVEPFRLGAFILFLREMGWARLHELPPLDRRALEMALEPPEPALTPALPEPPAAAPAPASLFAEIHASQLPTTNLEHLSEALDRLDDADEVVEDPFPPEAEVAPWSSAPTPPELALPIQHEAEGTTEPTPLPSAPPQAPSRRPLILGSLLALCLAGWGAVTWVQRRKAATPALPPPAVKPVPKLEAPKPEPEAAPAPAQPTPAPPEPKAVPQEAPQPPAKAEPRPEPKPEPKTEAGVPSKADRFQTIQAGDWKKAIAQGQLVRKSLQGKWSLRLEIACQGSTVQHAADLLKDRGPDLFILPMTMRDGRTCYQVFLGGYGSEAAAKEAARKLPAPFLAEGNRPKPFRVAQIPDRQ